VKNTDGGGMDDLKKELKMVTAVTITKLLVLGFILG